MKFKLILSKVYVAVSLVDNRSYL